MSKQELEVLSGFDVRVGNRPKPASWGTFYDINRIFKAAFEYFQRGNKEIREVWMDWVEGSPLNRFGRLTVKYARDWLAYYQLISVEKIREPLEKANGPWKNRTIWIWQPTPRGFAAYENGQVIEIDLSTYTMKMDKKGRPVTARKPLKVGIGSCMTYWDEVAGYAEAVLTRRQIAKSRRGEWIRELKDRYETFMDKPKVEAEEIVFNWASKKAGEWNVKHPKRHRRQKIKDPPANPETGEILLEKGQQTLLTFKVSGENIGS